jgi:hypothetical protein
MTATAPELGLIDVTNEEHHAIRALSNSGMADLAVSTLRYWYHHVNPAPKPDDEETVSQRMGSALHCAVLESEQTFEERYACELDASVWPVCLDTIADIRGWITDKGHKPKGTAKADVTRQALDLMEAIGERVPILEVEKARFFAQNKGKTILNVEEWERVAGMAQALLDEPSLKPILAKGCPEQTIVARDPETGVLLKSRLDWMHPKVTLDLKTFTQRRGKSIDKSIHDAIVYERYYIAAYFYSYVRSLASNEPLDRAVFVEAFVESDQPHETRIKSFMPKTGGNVNMYWELARVEVRRMIRLYADCLKKYGDEPWRDKQEVSTLTDEDVKSLAW